jgi:hypothetical protein
VTLVCYEVELRDLSLFREVELPGMRDADLASLDGQHLGVIFAHGRSRERRLFQHENTGLSGARNRGDRVVSHFDLDRAVPAGVGQAAAAG